MVPPPTAVRLLRTAEQYPRGIRERFVLRLPRATDRYEDKTYLGRSADFLVDTQNLTVEHLWEPFIAYEHPINWTPQLETPAPHDVEAPADAPLVDLDESEFWTRIALLHRFEQERVESALERYDDLPSFGAQLHALADALARPGVANPAQGDEVLRGSDAFEYWCHAVVLSGKAVYERALRGEPTTLSEQSWSDAEVQIAIVHRAIEGQQNSSTIALHVGASEHDDGSEPRSSFREQPPAASSVVGIWFVMALPSGDFSECIGVFDSDIFGELDLADEARAAAVWLARARSSRVVSAVEAFDTKCLGLYDGLEVFSARRKAGQLQHFLAQRRLVL